MYAVDNLLLCDYVLIFATGGKVQVSMGRCSKMGRIIINSTYYSAVSKNDQNALQYTQQESSSEEQKIRKKQNKRQIKMNEILDSS